MDSLEQRLSGKDKQIKWQAGRMDMMQDAYTRARESIAEMDMMQDAYTRARESIAELEADVEQKQGIIESSCKDTCDFYEELFKAIGITESTDAYKCDEEDILNAIEERVKRIAELEGLLIEARELSEYFIKYAVYADELSGIFAKHVSFISKMTGETKNELIDRINAAPGEEE